MSNTFEFVVDKYLGGHHNEAKGVDTASEGGEDEGVPAGRRGGGRREGEGV